MDGIEEKLSALFASPDSMAQIKRLAETLGVASGGGGASGGGTSGGESVPAGGGQDGASPGLGLDPKLMQTLMAVMREYSAPSQTASLVSSLRPWLRQDRAERLDKALRIARLTKAAKTVLPELGGQRHV